jgi:four helix bundle protein
MKIEKFEDLLIWQKAKIITVDIYTIFRNSKDFSFRDQIQRASVSIMNNTAEGFERKGNKEFNHFLSIAKGSAGEVRSMLVLAHELSYITKEQNHKLENEITDISKMIAGLMKTLK